MISIVLPRSWPSTGSQSNLMYTSSSTKGTDSDNVRHSGPDTSLSHQKRSLTSWNIYLKNKQLSHSCIQYNKSPLGNNCQKTIPLKVRIESARRDRRTFNVTQNNVNQQGKYYIKIHCMGALLNRCIFMYGFAHLFFSVSTTPCMRSPFVCLDNGLDVT